MGFSFFWNKTWNIPFSDQLYYFILHSVFSLCYTYLHLLHCEVILANCLSLFFLNKEIFWAMGAWDFTTH